MRKLYQMNTAGMPSNIQALFNEIFRASQEADVIDIGNGFSISGSFTETRTLNVTSPTIANVAAVLATLLLDLQRGGATRST